MKKKHNWRNWVFLACAVVFLASSSLLARDLIQSTREDQANQQLVQEVQTLREAQSQGASPSTAPPQEEEAEVPKYAENGHLYQYDALWQENHDLAGWLYIEGTDLDYPVMYTPEEPEYYLHRGFDREYAASGCLFIGPGSDPASSHVIVYGHHMKNGTMFGSLNYYKNAAYAQEHPVIHFDSLTEERSYEVVAAFYSRVYKEEERNVFRYYRYTDLSAEEDFNAYVEQVQSSALYDTGVEAVFGDTLLTLSTCSYHTENGRFVVVAKLVP